MAEQVLPDWIRKRKRRKEELTRKTPEAEEKRANDFKIMELGGPGFWKQFAQQLAFNAMACKELGIQATVSPITQEGSAGEGFQIHAALQSVTPNMNHLNIFYLSGSNQLECYPRDGTPYRIDLMVDSNGQILAFSKRRNTHASAEMLAEDVMEELVESIGG
jgi:hypothetical protein